MSDDKGRSLAKSEALDTVLILVGISGVVCHSLVTLLLRTTCLTSRVVLCNSRARKMISTNSTRSG
jgi:hypothetical protein